MENIKIIEAAENDNVHTLQKLTSSGVDVTGILYNVSTYVAIQYFHYHHTCIEYEFLGVQVTSYLHSVV